LSGWLIAGRAELPKRASKPVGPDGDCVEDAGPEETGWVGAAAVPGPHEGSGKFEFANSAQNPVVDEVGVLAVDAESVAGAGVVFCGEICILIYPLTLATSSIAALFISVAIETAFCSDSNCRITLISRTANSGAATLLSSRCPW
jgi:hypothetical protein